MFSEKNLWILLQILGLFLLFSSKWIPSPFNLVIGVILIIYGGKRYRDAGKKQSEEKKTKS